MSGESLNPIQASNRVCFCTSAYLQQNGFSFPTIPFANPNHFSILSQRVIFTFALTIGVNGNRWPEPCFVPTLEIATLKLYPYSPR